MKKEEVKIFLVSDVHIGDEHKQSLDRAEQLLGSTKFDFYINLGDVVDFPEISRFNEGLPGNKEGKRIVDSVRRGKEMLERHVKIARKKNPKCRCILAGSNHDEERLAAYAAKLPELKGMIEWETLMDFKSLGIEFFPSAKKPFTFRGFTFMHGKKATKYPIDATIAHYKCNCVIGHVHNAGTSIVDAFPKPLYGYSLGCLQNLHPDWQKDYVNRWNHSVAIMEFDGNKHQFFHVYL